MRVVAAVLLFSLSIPATLLGPASAAEPKSPATPAAKSKADPAIGRLLDKLDYKYDIDEEGDYRLTFGLGEEDEKKGRSQLVYVRSPVETYGSYRIREIWSPAYQASGDQFPAAVANRLLQATNESKMGAWAKQGKYAVFVVKLAADADASALDDAMEAALHSADEMEAELTPGKDDF